MDKICVRELFGIIQNIYLNRETGLLAFDFESGKRLVIFDMRDPALKVNNWGRSSFRGVIFRTRNWINT